jgi:hypothetical protein
VEFSEEFEIRLEFECITDRFSSGYLNLSDLLKNNKFTFSGLDSFQKPLKTEDTHNPDMYSIGDDDEEFQVENSQTQKKPEIKVKEEEGNKAEFEEIEEGELVEGEADQEEFEGDDLDDEEYFKKLEEEA